MNKDILVNKKKEISDVCLRRIKEALGEIETTLNPIGVGGGYKLHIATVPSLLLKVEVKSGIVTRNQAFHEIIQREKKSEGQEKAMIFSEWIPDRVAAEFRRAGIFYADVQGSLYLWKPPRVLIDIRGGRPEKPVASPGRLIDPGGLRVIHFLLTQPASLQNTLREIAGGAYVSLGTAHAVIHELERGQWLLPSALGGRRFRDRAELIDLFVKGYALKLRHTLFVGQYRHVRTSPQEIVDAFTSQLKGRPAQWAVTGGMAAQAITHYLEPDAVALFADHNAQQLLRHEPMLRDDSNGNVTLLNLFTSEGINTKLAPWPVADPLLVYAELLHEGRPREVETAGMIYEKILALGTNSAD